MTDMPASPVSEPIAAPFDRRGPLQVLLIVDFGVRLFIWGGSLAITVFVAIQFGGWAGPAWSRQAALPAACGIALQAILLVAVFNVAYLLLLLGLRMVTWNPKPGRYSIAGPRIDLNLMLTSFLWVLTKARYEAPFPAFLVPQLANLYPFRRVFNLKFGPRTQSVFFVEPHILDPSLITIGRNVTIGFGATIAGHIQDGDFLVIDPTIIEDDVLIGGHVTLAGGVTVRRGAIIRAHSLVLPGTVIGEYEYWAGIPARKMRDLGAAKE